MPAHALAAEGEQEPHGLGGLRVDGRRLLRDALAAELLDRMRRQSPAFFERLVLDLLVRMGYGGRFEDAAQAVGQIGDGGIDGIIKEDRLGLDVIYIQAKKWASIVGRPDVQRFVGSLSGHRAGKGVMISTAEFTAEAKDYVRFTPQKVMLIGGEELARLMIDHGVGVTEAAVYHVFRVDADYFGEEEEETWEGAAWRCWTATAGPAI